MVFGTRAARKHGDKNFPDFLGAVFGLYWGSYQVPPSWGGIVGREGACLGIFERSLHQTREGTLMYSNGSLWAPH
jgi:hypothetical protein